jgi:hypothetical protein
VTESASDESPAETVVFLSGDLIFASRVKAAAERADLAFRLSGSLPESETDSISYVILDLSTRSTLTAEIAAQCAQRCPHAKLVAYGPHVQTGRLAAAREAGIPVVMTRGQFDSKLATLFAG